MLITSHRKPVEPLTALIWPLWHLALIPCGAYSTLCYRSTQMTNIIIFKSAFWACRGLGVGRKLRLVMCKATRLGAADVLRWVNIRRSADSPERFHRCMSRRQTKNHRRLMPLMDSLALITPTAAMFTKRKLCRPREPGLLWCARRVSICRTWGAIPNILFDKLKNRCKCHVCGLALNTKSKNLKKA